MKIEVWSDYVCPFCYIGKKQLEIALEELGYGESIEVEYKSYLLDPTTPVDTDSLVYEELQRKYQMSLDEVKKMTANVTARAKEVGLVYNFDEMKSANTVKAHRLAKWAESEGKGKDFTERVLKAYFLEGKAIGQTDVLLSLVSEVNLSIEKARQVIENDDYIKEVEHDIAIAQNLGVRGVPFFVIDNKYGISGAQPQDVFEQTIEKAAQELGLRKPLKMQGDKGAACTDDSCNI
ncbi:MULTISPECIES: DsbA family oxidoreductase [Solibacillus]|uniref:DsbA family oxidoreductase n=1 Tax=Solibacillus merdavium TaxID=2762218 RepID=A0ABR8XP93_9BACL|nr:DsbA family oxidoreductase [Solibacillus merdavium]MBD8033764.1 DsbA family oxidoreductase [Solibacillus merdavium]